MTQSPESNKKLTSGSRVAIIGGGPAGSFSGFFLLDLAERLGLDLNVDIFEAQNFSKTGPAGCNHCGGIISESLVQLLSAEGITLSTDVVQRGIDAYIMHTDDARIAIETPLHEKRIAAVYRGGGPLRAINSGWESFDAFLLDMATRKGAQLLNERVVELSSDSGMWTVSTRKSIYNNYDLVVGAVGLNQASLQLFESVSPTFKRPGTTKTYICEFDLGRELVREYFGSSMHVFLLDFPRLKFAALVPKGEYVTLVILGSDVDKQFVHDFLKLPAVRGCFPVDSDLQDMFPCNCYPLINIHAARQPYADGLVLVGDSGVSKLYKNGIGAAYVTAKAAATTAVLHGISSSDFKQYYAKTCRNLNRDNNIGKLVFMATTIIQKSKMLKTGVLAVVGKERSRPGPKRYMSTVLWDTFTGSAPYTSILLRCAHPGFWGPLIWQTLRGVLPSNRERVKEQVDVKSNQLGKVFQDGENIIQQGDDGDCLYVIQSGSVDVIHSREGKEIHLATLNAGDFFGEMALFEREYRSSTVRALGEVRVITVDKRTLLTRIQDDPSLAFRILERMSGRIRDLNSYVTRMRETDRRDWDNRPEQFENSES